MTKTERIDMLELKLEQALREIDRLREHVLHLEQRGKHHPLRQERKPLTFEVLA